MPYPNEHAARLKDPANYVRFRRENDKFGSGIHAIWGIKASGTVELQAIRFDSKKFTAAQAKTWLKEHDYKPIQFEPATGKAEEGAMGTRVVQMPPLSVRADLGPRSIDEESRTVELIITTTTGVRRRDFWTGKEYIEVLSMDPAHVRLDRLNDGAPLLDSHNSFSVADQLGAVVPGTVELMKKALIGKVRFSKREAVEQIWQDVKDGIVRNVSVGYRIYKVEETPPKNDDTLAVRKAIDWEPFEVSMVPIPADAGAKVRAGDSADANQCEIVSAVPAESKAGQVPAESKEKTMPEDKRSQTILEPDPLAPPPVKTTAPTEPNDRDLGAAQERERIEGILTACRAARLPQSFADRLIKEGTALVKAQSEVFLELQRRDVNVPRGDSRIDVQVGVDPFVHVRAGIENALLHRCYPKQPGPKPGTFVGFELSEQGRQYRGMTMLRIAEAYLTQMGVRAATLSKMELASLALGLSERQGMHTTSDFALLLADVAGKTLRQAYEEAPQTFGPISRRITLPDFKDAKRLQIGEAPSLQQVDEHGEFTHGTIGEGREVFHLSTYGRIFAITRQALINDDTDAFSRVAMLFGRAARNLESDLVWAQITSNPVMGDGVNLFDAAHGNLDAVGAAISVEAIGEGRATMRVQTGLDGVTLLNISPAYLIVPAALETLADQFVSTNLMANQANVVNPFAGRLQVIAEPRLDADSTEHWYLAATPAQVDIIEYATLEGEGGPMVENRIGFEVDGLQIKARHDFAAKVIDWRGIGKNVGVSDT